MALWKNQLTNMAPMESLNSQGMNMLTYPFQELMNAVTKSVSVSIDSDKLIELKQGDYKLCFAKKVGEADYNVVWQSYLDYLEENSFSWIPVYSVFGSNMFKDSVTVKINCKPVSIKLGEQTTLNQAGVLSHPVTGGSTSALTILNEYKGIHPGVNQLSTGPDGSIISTPIYVAEKAALTGTIELRPKEFVMIWFEQDIQTGTMFSTARSKSIEVDLTSENIVNLGYDGNWKTI